MEKAMARFLSIFVERAADEFSNHGCNDVESEYFDEMSSQDKKQLLEEYKKWNSDDEDDRSIEDILDWEWLNFLAYKLKGS